MRKPYLPLSMFLSLVACAGSEQEPATMNHHDHHDPGKHGHHHPEGHDHAHHGGVHHDFSDAAEWSKRFDDPARDAWQKPDEIVKLLAIEPGMTVVDLGAGTGYFESRLATAVGPTGKVVALDPEANMVAFMRDRFEKAGVKNVEPRTCPLDSTGLQPASADRVLIVDTWHHIEKREAYAKHLASVLKNGGSVMIVDFTMEIEKGPPKELRIPPEKLVAELQAGGLEARVVDESLPDQLVVVGKKAL
jgi:ubiquinone/menaquinone biosynthesis C-methylase UbiE